MLDQGAIDWDDFRFVLAIVRGGSVSAAAKQLGVDHATVIRRVDRLEKHLSAKLFDRRKTGYLLTEAGQRVADSARKRWNRPSSPTRSRSVAPWRG
ncbi:molybdate transport repressor ModE-like protein [Bradyrhizobium sp. GM22.5]